MSWCKRTDMDAIWHQKYQSTCPAGVPMAQLSPGGHHHPTYQRGIYQGTFPRIGRACHKSSSRCSASQHGKHTIPPATPMDAFGVAQTPSITITPLLSAALLTPDGIPLVSPLALRLWRVCRLDYHRVIPYPVEVLRELPTGFDWALALNPVLRLVGPLPITVGPKSTG